MIHSSISYLIISSPEDVMNNAEVITSSGNNAMDIFSSIYLIGGGILVSLFSWGMRKLIQLVNEKVKNEIFSGIISRLISSINDAVAMVNQTLKKEMLKAKDESSPGGVKFTDEEKSRLVTAVWNALKDEYGGTDGLFKQLKRIGIGDPVSAKNKINTMIESSVNRQKAIKSSPS